MKKKILLVLLILVLLGTGVVYTFMATDAFKSNKVIFFSHLVEDMFSDFESKDLAKYMDKQQESSYTNKGEMSVHIGEDDSLAATKMLNDGKITFEGKINKAKKLAEQEIAVSSGRELNIPINFKQVGDVYGVQLDILNSKYVAVRNEKLNDLLKKFNIEVEGIPDKIDFSQQKFTEEELKELQKTYFKLLNENLDDNLFSKEKSNNQTIIKLTIPKQKCAELLIKILETVKNDEILLNKFSTMYQKEDIQRQLDIQIESLKDIETEENNLLEMKMYVQSKKMKKLEIAIKEENEITSLIGIEKDTNQMNIKVYDGNVVIGDINILKEENGNNVIFTIKTIFEIPDEEKTEMTIKLQYNNITELNNVEEIYDINMKTEGTNEYSSTYGNITEVGFYFKNLITFESNVEISELNSENSIILNDATDKELQNLILGIYQNLGLM